MYIYIYIYTVNNYTYISPLTGNLTKQTYITFPQPWPPVRASQEVPAIRRMSKNWGVCLQHVKIWRFPKIGVPQNHLKLNHFSIETHGFGVPLFMETTIYYV